MGETAVKYLSPQHQRNEGAAEFLRKLVLKEIHYTHSYVMTWLALSWEGLSGGKVLLTLLLLESATFALRPAPGAGQRGLLAEVMSSRSRSCSLA